MVWKGCVGYEDKFFMQIPQIFSISLTSLPFPNEFAHWVTAGGYCFKIKYYWGGPKMATGTQVQTARTLWIRGLAGTLEPRLVEVKHRESWTFGTLNP
jgi:hypothetical protein